MGHRDQDEKKVAEMSLFFKSEKLVQTDKSKNLHNLESFYLILARKIVPNKISGFRRNLGCFFQNVHNTAFLLVYYSACK